MVVVYHGVSLICERARSSCIGHMSSDAVVTSRLLVLTVGPRTVGCTLPFR